MSHVLALQSRIARAGLKMRVVAPIKSRSFADCIASAPTLLFRIEREMNSGPRRPAVRVVLGEGENRETLQVR